MATWKTGYVLEELTHCWCNVKWHSHCGKQSSNSLNIRYDPAIPRVKKGLYTNGHSSRNNNKRNCWYVQHRSCSKWQVFSRCHTTLDGPRWGTQLWEPTNRTFLWRISQRKGKTEIEETPSRQSWGQLWPQLQHQRRLAALFWPRLEQWTPLAIQTSIQNWSCNKEQTAVKENGFIRFRNHVSKSSPVTTFCDCLT